MVLALTNVHLFLTKILKSSIGPNLCSNKCSAMHSEI
jgi:hypothetical protein